MKPTKPIREWKNVFLDTSFIIDYLSDPERYVKNPPVKERIEFAHQLMKVFASNKLENGTRLFIISAFTITELRKLSMEHTDKTLIKIFQGNDIVFVSYTKQVALYLNQNLETLLPNSEKHQFIAQLEKTAKLDGVVNAKQWISTDLMIAGCAKFVKDLDVLLTSDKKTFKVIADKLELPCVTMFKEDMNFDLFGDVI
jgi:hypothetical protein